VLTSFDNKDVSSVQVTSASSNQAHSTLFTRGQACVVGSRYRVEGGGMSKSPQSNGDAAALVRKLWQYCNVLRDDGLSYPDYVEQLTYLLFLKMSDEQKDGPVPPKYSWRSLEGLEVDAMHRPTVLLLAEMSQGRWRASSAARQRTVFM
jgi:hypothetical protein